VAPRGEGKDQLPSLEWGTEKSKEGPTSNSRTNFRGTEEGKNMVGHGRRKGEGSTAILPVEEFNSEGGPGKKEVFGFSGGGKKGSQTGKKQQEDGFDLFKPPSNRWVPPGPVKNGKETGERGVIAPLRNEEQWAERVGTESAVTKKAKRLTRGRT